MFGPCPITRELLVTSITITTKNKLSEVWCPLRRSFNVYHHGQVPSRRTVLSWMINFGENLRRMRDVFKRSRLGLSHLLVCILGTDRRKKKRLDLLLKEITFHQTPNSSITSQQRQESMTKLYFAMLGLLGMKI